MTNPKLAIIAASVPVGLAIVVGALFGIGRWTGTGEILGSVVVEDVELGGLGRDDAARRLADLEETLATTPIEVTAAGETFTLIPADVGYDADTGAVLEQAFTEGRRGGVLNQMGWWMSSFRTDGETIELPAAFDADAVDALIAEWEIEGIDDPPSPGDVEMVGYFVEHEYPRTGTGIDREAAAVVLAEAILDPSRPAVELPTRRLQPVLTEADIDAVVAKADTMLSGPVVLWNQEVDHRIEIPRSVLALSLEIERNDETEVPTFDFSWNDGPLREWVEPRVKARSTEARDARIVINDDDTVTLVPSIPAQEPDLEPLAEQVADAAGSVTRFGPLAYLSTGEAEFSTADAEALGIRGKISEFTTFHNCCENRVINIQTIADAVDGAMVMPGETFSLNEHVGQRTTAKGYVRAGAIIGGVVQCCDSPINIGGGTSQFTTTMYNAIFYAGLEDVYHFPHTIYFSRYPEGIEATLGYPNPDLVFRNDTQSVVLIRTEHTPTSITVKFFGDNGGLEVEAEKSGRYGYHGPITTYERVDDPDLCDGRNGTTRIKEKGSSGWWINVYRHITYPEGHYNKPEGGTDTEEWVVHYQGGFKVIEYDTDDCVPEE